MKQLKKSQFRLNAIAIVLGLILVGAAAGLIYHSSSEEGVSEGAELESQSYTQIQEACLDQEDSAVEAEPYEAQLLKTSIYNYESETASRSTPLPISEVYGALLAQDELTSTINLVLTDEAADAAVTTSEPDRSLPIYEVYCDGWYVEVSAEIQWIIRDFAEKYDFDEKVIFGCCLAESCFDTDAGKYTSSSYKGLTQIGTYWIYADTIPRFEENSASRDLYDPYDHLLTLMELWCYARDAYGIDTSTSQGMADLLYWHNTGSYVKNVNWYYSQRCLSLAGELVEIQY